MGTDPLSVHKTGGLSSTVGLSWDMDLDDPGKQDAWVLRNF